MAAHKAESDAESEQEKGDIQWNSLVDDLAKAGSRSDRLSSGERKYWKLRSEYVTAAVQHFGVILATPHLKKEEKEKKKKKEKGRGGCFWSKRGPCN